jgi:hypothetical protein
MKRALIVLMMALLFLTSYGFENFYLQLNGQVKSGTTYKANTEIPAWIRSLEIDELKSLKWLVNGFHILLNGLILLTMLVLTELERRWMLYHLGLYIAISSTCFIILLFSGDNLHLGSLSISQLARSPLPVLFLVISAYVQLTLRSVK